MKLMSKGQIRWLALWKLTTNLVNVLHSTIYMVFIIQRMFKTASAIKLLKIYYPEFCKRVLNDLSTFDFSSLNMSELSMISIITQLVQIFIRASWIMPSVSGVSHCVKCILVTSGCFLIFGRIVVSLTQSQFPFSILLLLLLFTLMILSVDYHNL